METFVGVDKFYDITSADDLWDTSDLDPTMQDVMRLNGSIVNDLAAEWSFLEKLPVVLHDKLMTDAVLGNRPIKTEHSYSLTSDGDSLPESPISSTRMDVFSDMDDECFNAISASEACGRLSPDEIDIKDEPISESDSSCSSSPQHSSFLNQDTCSVDAFFNTDVEMKSPPKSILKHRNVMLTAGNNIFSSAKLPNIKTEPGSSFSLPPTPPSCSSSEESEDNITVTSPSAAPATVVVRTKSSATTARVLLNHYITRQPIHTPLISSQPKGSTGTLMLTEEEKRTLIAEGYPVPTRLPLTKAEEKSLKKIRRKIKNKISAQESRRKKKEYMDQLERKVELLVTENSDYRKQIDNLEGSNSSLLNQLAKLQAIVARTHPHLVKKN